MSAAAYISNHKNRKNITLSQKLNHGFGNPFRDFPMYIMAA